MKGKLLIFSGPSGSGKTTIVHYLLKTFPELEFSISATSRNRRPHEINGKDYFFLSPKEFREKIENNEFIEWEEVYENQFYGTLKYEVDRILDKGRNIVFDVDVKGGLNIKELYEKDALAVFVKVPTYKELEKRLRMRLTEDEESFRKRMGKAREEMNFSNKYDIILVNNMLNKVLLKAEDLVRNFLFNENQ